jgi:hypothetical protein
MYSFPDIWPCISVPAYDVVFSPVFNTYNFLKNLLTCNSCTEEYIVILTIVLTINLRFAPSINLPHLSLPLLRIISTGFILLFSYTGTKYIHYIHLHSPFPYPHSPPTGTHSQKKNPILLSCPSFK